MSLVMFHCAVCFESFDCDKHWVVLPCAHACTCNECANRIGKQYESCEDLIYCVEDETKTTAKHPTLSQHPQRASPAASLCCVAQSSQSKARQGIWSMPTNNNNNSVIPKK